LSRPLLVGSALALAFQVVGCQSDESPINANIKAVGPPAGENPPPATSKRSRKGKGRELVPSIWERRREVGKVARD